MSSTVRHVGLKDPLVAFPTLERRSLAVNTANRQIAVGDEAPGAATGLPLSLIGIRFFATTAQYVTDDMVVHLGQIWKARATIAPGSPFSPSDWVGMTDGGQFVLLDGSREMYGNLEIDKPGASLVLNATGPSQADVWFRRDSLTRWLLRSDETAAVDLHIYRFDDAGFVIDAPLTVSRSTGRLSILTNPTLPLELVPKQYVDAGIAAAAVDISVKVNKSGDTMTGGLVVPVLTINNPSYSDLYYSNGGHVRWLIRGADAAASNLEFHHYAPDGTYRGAALVLDQANGDATFQGVIRAAPGLTFGSGAPTGFYGDGTNIAIRTYGGNGIYFQTAGGGTNYALMHAGGLDVYGVITSTAQDGLRITVPPGYYARTYYTVSGVRAWTAGVYADGRYVIGDESAGAARFIINLDGSIEMANNLNVPGTLTAGTVNASTANITTGNFGQVNTGGLNASGNADIGGNLVVHGTVTSSGSGGGGTPITTSASGYQCREGTPGPFYMQPWWNLDYGPGYSGPYYFNITPAQWPGDVGGMPVWINHKAQAIIPYSLALVTAAEIKNKPAWEAIKAVSEPRLGIKDGKLVDPGEPAVMLASDDVLGAMLKALKQAMARIEALELKVEELSHARSG